MTIRVRLALPEDVHAVRFVGHATWPATYGPEMGAEYVLAGLDNYWNSDAITNAIQRGCIDVAESADVIVGMTHVEELGPDLVMWKLYVVPDQQHQGTGHALVGSAKVRAVAHGSDLLTEYEPGNERVRGFYEREGFDATPAPWPGTDAIWLRWRSGTVPH